MIKNNNEFKNLINLDNLINLALIVMANGEFRKKKA